MGMNLSSAEERHVFEIGLILSLTLIILLTIGSCSVERMANRYLESGAWMPGTVETEK